MSPVVQPQGFTPTTYKTGSVSGRRQHPVKPSRYETLR
jgi:hypothetical protein